MNQEFDEVVRDSMTWFTDGVDVPAGRHLGQEGGRRRHDLSVHLTGGVS